MRTIKFRGLYKKSFVYGNLIICDIEGNKTAQIEHSDFNEFRKWDVDIETVGQFTGLKDMNGKEIYESDLLKHNNNIYQVIHSKNQYVLLLKDCNLKSNWRSLEWCNNISKYIEIIGNIFMNPELLKS
ncbi:hypothetical protein KAR91_56240 [Candidatus Pacearchaeota archaeon]|nr:hypothetical protein [Candidatus Pacearchaeota archaeon]